MEMLRAEHISKAFDSRSVLRDVTVRLEEGELVEFDARVHFTGGAVVGLKKKLRIKVYDALSEEVLK